MALPFLSPLSDGPYHFLPCVGVTYAHGSLPLSDTSLISPCMRAASKLSHSQQKLSQSLKGEISVAEVSGRASKKRRIWMGSWRLGLDEQNDTTELTHGHSCWSECSRKHHGSRWTRACFLAERNREALETQGAAPPAEYTGAHRTFQESLSSLA